MLGRGWGNRRARMARYRPVGAPSHRAAIRLARTRYGAQRGTIASAPDHAAPDGGTQGRSASSMRARVVLAGWSPITRDRVIKAVRGAPARGRYRTGRAYPAATRSARTWR